MNKPVQIIIYIMLGIVILHMAIDIFGTQSNIRSVIKNLERSQDNIDNAVKQIDSSQKSLGAMQEDLQKFSLYIRDIQQHVELSDNEKKFREALTMKAKDSIRSIINNLKNELKETDTLPDIPIK
jgi:hypothetical protein